jgi:serine protease Do
MKTTENQSSHLRSSILGIAITVLITGAVISSGAFGLNWNFINKYIKLPPIQKPVTSSTNQPLKIVSEENVVVDVVDKVSPSVVTVGISQTRRIGDLFNNNNTNMFDPFGFFGQPMQPSQPQKVEQDIGSGFIVGSDGLIVTNKHVVSVTDAKYRVITKDNKTYDIVKIYRDPANDLAVIKIAASGLPTVDLGDSDKIKIGQMAIAIGTALGEFRNTVTVGIVSGIGRGITAGGQFDGSAEKLDNVIQTDAALNPGNSGGPLLNSSGQVIGINTAIAQDGQNIGFAIPVNVIKEALSNFNSTGQFNRPFLGVEYRIITRQMAVLNDIPEGAYISNVVSGGPAEKGGVQDEDIITKIDGTKVTESNDLASIISKKKVGDRVHLTIWREEKETTVDVTIGTQDGQ